MHRLLPEVFDSKSRMHKKFIPISHGGRHKVATDHGSNGNMALRTGKKMLLTQLLLHQGKPSFACTCALPFSFLQAMLVALVLGLRFCPCTLAAPAWSRSGFQQPHPVLAKACSVRCTCADSCVCPVAQQCASRCGTFSDYFTIVPCKDSPPPRLIELAGHALIAMLSL